MRNYKRVYLYIKKTFCPEHVGYSELTKNTEEDPILGVVWTIPKDAKMEGL